MSLTYTRTLTNDVEPYFIVKASIRRYKVTREGARILKCLLVHHSGQWVQSSNENTITLILHSRKQSRSPPNVRIIANAIRENRDLIITYVNREGNSTCRLITPCELYTGGNVVYLRAYCHLCNAYRIFRVNGI